MRRIEATFYSEEELRTLQAMRGAPRPFAESVTVEVGIKRGETFLEGFKVGGATKRAQMSVTNRQGIAALTEVSENPVEGHNTLDMKAAGAQRSRRITVSNTSGPRIGGGSAKKRAFGTGGASFPRRDRARNIPSWKPRVPAREGISSTFDRVAERTAGLSS